MRKKNLSLQCAALVLSISTIVSFPSMASSTELGPGTVELISQRLDEKLDDTWVINGLHAIDAQGNIYFSENGEDFAKQMTAKDGCVYDENGIQKNTLKYVHDKYWDQYQSTQKTGKVVFDNQQEAYMFVMYLQLLGEAQGKNYHVFHTSGKQISIPKEDLLEMEKQSDLSYIEAVQNICRDIKPASIEKMAETANLLVAQYLTYNEGYNCKTLAEAVKDKYGVCYHYAKLLHEVLNELGVQSEYMIGRTEREIDTAHVWIKAWDHEANKWLYLDPTYAHMDLKSGVFPVQNYHTFAGHTQYGVTYVPTAWE